MEQLKGLKQELFCHQLARDQAMAFNKCIRGFALGAATSNNPLYAALRRNPSGLQVNNTQLSPPPIWSLYFPGSE